LPCKTWIDISEASHAKPLLEEVLKGSNGKWRLSLNKDKADVRYLWCNCEEGVITSVLAQKGRVVNRYPSIKGLSHKDTFARFMQICTAEEPDAYRFVPPQFEYPKEREKLIEYMKNH
jgi:hypothetical protein